MKTDTTAMQLQRWIPLLVGLTCWVSGMHAWAQKVQVISSETGAAYRQAWQSFADEMARAGLVRNDVQLRNVTDLAHGGAIPDETKVVVTLGAQALQWTLANNNGKSVVLAALIPRAGFERTVAQAGKKQSAAVSALYLDQPFSRQLTLLRLAIPAARSVGVIWGPESMAQRSQIVSSARAQGLQLRESELDAGGGIVSALKQAMTDADVLLAVPDSRVYNAATASDILLTTYHARIPVIAFSPSYAKAGAVLSLYSSPTQVGVQAAAMVGLYLQTATLPASQYPIEFSIDVNEYVARSLGLTIDVRHLSSQIIAGERRP